MMPNALRDWAYEHLDVRSESGDELDVLCPIHGDHNASMRLNIEKGLCFCHACGVAGTIAKIAKAAGLPFSDNGDFDIETEIAYILGKLDKDGVVEEQRLDINLSRYNNKLEWWTDPLPNGRGFTQETLEKFELGYDLFNNVATIPIRDIEGNLLGITRRRMSGDGPKYLDPKGFKKSRHLYASWLAVNECVNTLIITEGPLDAVNVWQAGYVAVAQYGSNLTPGQIQLIKTIDPSVVVLFYDNDDAGRKAANVALGWSRRIVDGEVVRKYDCDRDLSRHVLVRCVRYPLSVKAKDPGSLDGSTIARLVEDAEDMYGR